MTNVDSAEQAIETLSFVLGDEDWKRDALCLEYPSVVGRQIAGSVCVLSLRSGRVDG
jgi:hypothetical protein